MKQAKEVCQYGLWPSRLSPKTMGQSRRLTETQWDDDGKTLVWLEGRSDRNVLVVADVTTGEAPRDLTSDLSVRGKVGYGGGDFTVARGSAFFVDGTSGRLFRQDLKGGAARALTPAFGDVGAPRVSKDGRFVAYVHHDSERNDRIAVVDTDGKCWPRIFTEGQDFYTQIRWSPDGMLFAYVAWNQPHMPWDGSRLFLAPVEYGKDGLPSLGKPKCIAGNEDTSVFQPEFTPDGHSLIYASDESGFWQLHRYDLLTGASRQLTDSEQSEYGFPNWAQEQRLYALTADGKNAIAGVNKRGFIRLNRIDLISGDAHLVDALQSYTDLSQTTISPASGRLAFLGSSPAFGVRLVVYDPATDDVKVLARTSGETMEPGDLSEPVAVTWASGPAGEEAHGLFYPPASATYQASGKPPLVVIVHGGPTSQARAGYSAQTLFFTTRGYGVLLVNHRGSTGYGRKYMLKQRGKWGLVDVEDAVSGAKYLGEQGKIDSQRTVIMGGSAGGYTVLQTLVDVPEAFTAGICLYGIANQFTLVADTHKFEERYSDMLLGTLPEAAELYRQRSPLFHATKIKRPLAVFQGDKDQVVPKDQSDVMVKALQRNGTPCVYHVYEGEGHGFRKAETLEHFYRAVDAFLRENVIYR